jgi:ArsR family metal-binding transcriptional regulator
MEMDQLNYTVDEKGTLVKVISIKNIKPCIATEGKVRVLIQTDAELKDVIPAMVTRYPPGKVNYIQRKNILTLTLSNRLITLYPSGKVTMNKTKDKEDAVMVMGELIKDINQVYTEIQDGGVGDYSGAKEKTSRLGPLAIYYCLPQTNCEECGEATCMAFAIKLLAGDVTLDLCAPLLTSEHTGNVNCLEELLGKQIMHTMGWKD